MPATAPAESNLFPSLNARQAIKFALSLVLFYWYSLATNQDLSKYGALAIVICSIGTRGASLEKSTARIIGTTFGVVVGLIILALFNHDRWATMLAFACYLTFVSYFMQGSPNSYAWYVAAFVPLVVWGDNFPQFGGAFDFGAYRWLETTMGVVCYTVVDLVLWPRQAGDQLNQQGQSLWADVQSLLAAYRAELKQVDAVEGTSELRAKIAGTRAGTMASLRQAYLDTPRVGADKRRWHIWQTNTEAMLDALAIWHPAVGDVRPLNLDQLLPQLDSALQTLEIRITRIGVRWRQKFAGHAALIEHRVLDSDDGDLLQPFDLKIVSAGAELSHSERAALSCFVEQLKILDGASREVLRSGRALADLGTSRANEAIESPPAALQPTPWVERRFVHALFPAVAFVLAFFFWILVCPPTGPKVPMFAGIIGLATLRAPFDPRKAVIAFVLSIFLAVAPVYWLVMPHLSGPMALLAFVFLYAALFSYLGRYNPMLKIGPMVQFVMSVNITNEQSYSFQGLVDGGLMTVMGGGFAAIAYMFFSTLRPEVAMLRWLKRFFDGCARYTGGFNLLDATHQSKHRARRRRTLQSMVLPAPAKIQAAQKQLDYKSIPDEPAENLQRLHDCVQSIAYRLQSLEIVTDRAASHVPDHHESLTPFGRQVQEIVQDVFQCWADSDLELDEYGSALERLSGDLQTQLDALAAKPEPERLSDRALSELYTVVGAIRGLIDAMTSTQTVMKQVNWRRLATPRF